MKVFSLLKIFIIVTGLSFLSSFAIAEIIDVNLGESIQLAIDGATFGDEVHVAPGTYYQFDIQMKDGVSLIGSGYSRTIIDGQNQVDPNADWMGGVGISCFSIGDATKISGFTITNVQTGIYCRSSTLTIENNYITNLRRPAILDDPDPPSNTGGRGIVLVGRLSTGYCSPIIRNNVLFDILGKGIDGEGECSPQIINIRSTGRLPTFAT